MGPTVRVLEMTTIPISESVPCQATPERAPASGPPSSWRLPRAARTSLPGNGRSRFFKPGCYAPIVFAGHEHEGIGGADLHGQRLQRRGAEPRGYSLYMRSSIGRPTALASISSISSPRALRPRRGSRRGGCPSGPSGRSRRRRGCDRPFAHSLVMATFRRHNPRRNPSSIASNPRVSTHHPGCRECRKAEDDGEERQLGDNGVAMQGAEIEVEQGCGEPRHMNQRAPAPAALPRPRAASTKSASATRPPATTMSVCISTSPLLARAPGAALPARGIGLRGRGQRQRLQAATTTRTRVVAALRVSGSINGHSGTSAASEASPNMCDSAGLVAVAR